MPDFAIRDATKDDIPLLLTMIRELAEVEGFPFAITVTAEDLRNNLFGPRPAAEALIGEIDGAPACFAVFYETFATTTGRRGLHLDDLYVRAQFQGMGLGRRLMIHLAALARARACARFEWWVLQWNASAIEFYTRMGARRMQELEIFRLDGAALETLS